MTEDARFEDGAEGPLRLRAETAEDVPVLSALLQDAVLTAADVSWMPRRRRVGILLNRFRWEDRAAAEAAGRGYERVRSLLLIDAAIRLRSNGIDPGNGAQVLSLLSVAFHPGDDGAGRFTLTLAGDGALSVEVEAVDLRLQDVTRPHGAASAQAPRHDLSDGGEG